ncbi:MGA_1079 family surface serine endopeptidase [Mycoplasma sp. 1018B]|uniref:MGA_1079 family surface serine endopeptidase n=1 Tax=Mycoplasma sp. 1018B TaxID=2967302 RepID=UPI00211CC9B6|nr:lipoprotein 17-related variable surface protein [Mycoplasma sp. 1018B]UUM18967.1 lipoprotein 17-related variable surface protein [Mycoplasma sp. 1018B]
MKKIFKLFLNLLPISSLTIFAASCINKDIDSKNIFDKVTIEFDYPNKENTLVADFNINNLTYQVKNNDSYNISIDNLQIIQTNSLQGQITLNYILKLDYQNRIYKSQIFQKTITDFKKYQSNSGFTQYSLFNQNQEQILLDKNQLNNQNLIFDVLDKNNLLASSVNESQIITKNSNVDNDYQIIIKLNEANDLEGSLKIHYQIINKNNCYNSASNILEYTIFGFQKTNNFNNKENHQLWIEANNELNNWAQEVIFDYENKENVLSSQAQINSFIWKNQNQKYSSLNLEIYAISDFDDYDGSLLITYALKRDHHIFGSISSNLMQIKVDFFAQLKKQKTQIENKLLKILKELHKKADNIFTIQTNNNLENLTIDNIKIDQSFLTKNNINLKINDINYDAKNGLIEINYQVKDQSNNANFILNNQKLLLFNHFNNQSVNNNLIIDAQRELNDLNLNLDYSNKEKTKVEDLDLNKIFIVDNNDYKLVNLEIINLNKEIGQVTLAYQISKYNNNLKENIYSQIFYASINNFLKVMPNENQINTLTKQMNELNYEFDYPNKENTLVKHVLYENLIVKNLNSNYPVESFRNLQFDLETNTIKFEYRLIKKETNVVSNWKQTQLNGFLNWKQSSTLQELNSFMKNFELKINQDINPDLHIKLYSTSINKTNALYFLNLINDKNIKLTVKDLELDKNDINTLHLILVATKNDISIEDKRSIKFTNDFNDLTANIKINNIESLYNVDYQLINLLSGQKIYDNLDLLEQAFEKKNTKVNNLFDFKINWDRTSSQIVKVTKNIRINSKPTEAEVYEVLWNFSIDLFYNNLLIKTIDNVKQTIDHTRFELFTNNFLYTFINKQASDFNYKPSEYFIKEAKFENNTTNVSLSNYFAKAASDIKKETGNKYKSIPANLSWLNKDDSLTRELFKEIILKSFDFELGNWQISEVLKFAYIKDPSLTNILNFAFVHGPYVKVLVKLTKGEQELIYPIIFSNLIVDQTNRDSLVFTNLIKNNNVSRIIRNLKVKEAFHSHEDYIPSQIYDKLNDLYELAKQGEYSIKFLPKELAQIRNNAYYNENDGTATVRFGLYKNDEFTGIKTNSTFTLRYFKELEAQDFAPKNRWFVTDDFNNEQYQKPEANIINLVDQINSTNFTYNFVQGEYRAQTANNDIRTRRTLDPKLIMQQKAFDKLNHLLRFVSNNNNQLAYAQIRNEKDQENNLTLNPLTNNYFIYFYDVKSDNNHELTFKLGVINKKNSQIRYTANKEITLKNLYNDYQLEAYPLALINNLTNKELIINKNEIAKLTVNEFNNLVKNNLEQANQLVKMQQKAYHDFTLDNWENNLSIDQVKIINKEQSQRLFVSFKYNNYLLPKATGDVNQVIKGDVWYEINGFKNQIIDNINNEEILDNLNAVYDMKKVFLANDLILRRRKINLNYKDNYFEIDKANNQVNWIFKKDYYEAILNRKNLSESKIKFHFFANLLYQDAYRIWRISKYDRGISVDLDYEKLLKEKQIIIDQETSATDEIKVKYRLTFTLTNEGIKFNYSLLDNDRFRIVGDQFAKRTYFHDANNLPEIKFNPDEAIFFNQNFGSSVVIEYANKQANETFSQYLTNKFDYQNMSINKFDNMPYYIYNEGYNHNELFKYNPNETLPYKWHEGYKTSIEMMHQSYKDPRINDINNRVLGLGQGSSLLIGKVSDDPKDGKYYFITNNHVVNNNNFVENPVANAWQSRNLVTHSSLDKLWRSGDIFEGGWNDFNNTRVQTFVFWTGIKQITEAKEARTGLNVDLSAYMIDINEAIDNLKNQGKYKALSWFENIKNLPDLNVSNYNKDNFTYFLNAVNRDNARSFKWEYKPIYSTNRLFTGWPAFRQVSHIVNRNNIGDNREFFTRTSDSTSYAPILFRGGLSGTGIVDDRGNYISSINSAALYYLGTSWYNYSKIWEANKKDYLHFNYFGFVDQPEDLLNAPNTNSLAANFLKLSAWDSSIKIPDWIINPIKLTQFDNQVKNKEK